MAEDAFPRIRVGVGRDGDSNDLIEQCSTRFFPIERQVADAAIARAAVMAIAIMRDGIAAAMNVWNRAGAD